VTLAIGVEPLVVPASHRDLLTRPICGVLTTIGPDGHPHSSLVWVDVDATGCARFNTTLERQQARNLRRDPRASLLVVDPEDTGRFLQVRGDVQLFTNGAVAHLHALARRYGTTLETADETRVIGRIRARRITLDAIHA
jgi:PPOX class probable F420-dependent enzyme